MKTKVVYEFCSQNSVISDLSSLSLQNINNNRNNQINNTDSNNNDNSNNKEYLKYTCKSLLPALISNQNLTAQEITKMFAFGHTKVYFSSGVLETLERLRSSAAVASVCLIQRNIRFVIVLVLFSSHSFRTCY